MAEHRWCMQFGIGTWSLYRLDRYPSIFHSEHNPFRQGFALVDLGLPDEPSLVAWSMEGCLAFSNLALALKTLTLAVPGDFATSSALTPLRLLIWTSFTITAYIRG